jgi:hypothetical protein
MPQFHAGKWHAPQRRPPRPAICSCVRSVRKSFGIVAVAGGRVLLLMGFIVARGRIVAIDVLFAPERPANRDLANLDDAP